MKLVEALLDLLPGRETGDPDATETFDYRCRDCDHEFASPERHVTDARCPACGAGDVRVAENPYLSE